MNARLLVVEDDAAQRMLLERSLEKAGFEVQTAGDAAECLRMVAKRTPAVVCVDLGLPGGISGFDLIAKLRGSYPGLGIVVLTLDAAVESVVRAMKAGASDYVTKPWTQARLAAVLGKLTAEPPAAGGGRVIVGESPSMAAVMRQVARVAASEAAVLIRGESGSGKELIAHSIHRHSRRAENPFVAVNSAAIPESLIESELFGHEKGAFTGASARRVGHFESAHTGTLFLDEIGELPLHLQAKLLRVLQEKTFQRLGGSELVRSDFRLITATNRDLEISVRREEFRADLYFRVAVVEIAVPPLRDRRADIPVLAEFFLRQFAGPGSPVQGISESALSAMSAYDWPGNVRELQNAIHRAVVMAEGPLIEVRDLSERLTSAETASTPVPASADSLDESEAKAILESLARHGGNASAAIRELRIGRARFYRRLRKLGLEDQVERLRESKG